MQYHKGQKVEHHGMLGYVGTGVVIGTGMYPTIVDVSTGREALEWVVHVDFTDGNDDGNRHTAMDPRDLILIAKI